jgi:hypothetical protein
MLQVEYIITDAENPVPCVLVAASAEEAQELYIGWCEDFGVCHGELKVRPRYRVLVSS